MSPCDFGSINSSFSLSKRDKKYCQSISIIPDHIHEDNEKFQLLLSGYSLPNYVSISPAVCTVTIINIKSKLSQALKYLFQQ